jgi:hypothetical protein
VLTTIRIVFIFLFSEQNIFHCYRTFFIFETCVWREHNFIVYCGKDTTHFPAYFLDLNALNSVPYRLCELNLLLLGGNSDTSFAQVPQCGQSDYGTVAVNKPHCARADRSNHFKDLKAINFHGRTLRPSVPIVILFTTANAAFFSTEYFKHP